MVLALEGLVQIANEDGVWLTLIVSAKEKYIIQKLFQSGIKMNLSKSMASNQFRRAKFYKVKVKSRRSSGNNLPNFLFELR